MGDQSIQPTIDYSVNCYTMGTSTTDHADPRGMALGSPKFPSGSLRVVANGVSLPIHSFLWMS